MNRSGCAQQQGVRRARLARVGVLSLALASLMLSTGCMRNRKAPPRARSVAPAISRDVPGSLRGTIGAEASVRGIAPLLVSGIGYVVGLDGTGGLPMPEEYAATMEREMGLGGIGRANDIEGTAFRGKSPRQLLNDPNTAVVIVQGAIPPGARAGTSFDLYIRAVNATSLEGGRLYTTKLRPGPPTAFGGDTTLVVGDAKGPIFINPFADPGSTTDGVTRDVGRILDGGVVHEDLLIEILLDNPSHSRARRITSAINSRFPERTGDDGPLARGKDDTLVRVRVPRRFEDRPAEFLQLVMHLQIDRTYPELYAQRYARTMNAQPYLADDMGWCLEAIGEAAKPFVRDLYEHPEAAPRLAALRAGVGLGDARAAPFLKQIALDGPDTLRPEAIELLGRLNAGPTVDQTLKGLLASNELTIRVAAYEALVGRAIKAQRRRLMRMVEGETGPGAFRLTRTGLDAMARMSLPRGSIQGISRELVAGKFFLDRVPGGDPLVYVTQQGEPRIVLFGGDIKLTKPSLVTAWENRLMLSADSESDPVRLYYRDQRTGRVIVQDAEEELDKLIKMFARDQSPTDPRTGLGLTYAETVGAVYNIYNDGGFEAAFSTEQDRLLAELIRSSKAEEITVRPATPGSEERLVVFDSPRLRTPSEQRRAPRREGLLVPLTPPPPEENGEGKGEGEGEAGDTGQ